MNRSVFVAFSFLLVSSGLSQDLAQFEKKVTEFRLENGLKFLVVERHQAPVVAFHTYADVGSVDEVKGTTGLAHIFEHMAFKGSRRVGTKNYEAEVKTMAEEDRIFLALKAERRQGESANLVRLKQLEEEFELAQQAAEKYVVDQEFSEAFSRRGGVGLNASTSADSTNYYLSLPSNKVELWMSLESERFLKPVLRGFYQEKSVVMEERRLRVESRHVGRLQEEFLAAAYKAHPYGEPPVGHMSDLQTVTRSEAESFFGKYYVPSNLTIVVVGDVDPLEIRKLAEIYFGRIPARAKPDPVETVEPPQSGERRIIIEDPAQPFLLVGYHKPNLNHPDSAVFDAITDILAIGRTSRLYRSLVKERKIAVIVSAHQGFPGSKYPGLFVFVAIPATGHTAEECERAIYVEIDRLKTELASMEELEKAKRRSRASLVRQLDSNSGLATQLAFYHVLGSDWRTLFTELEKMDQVGLDDIQRVARQYFNKNNRTVGLIVTTESGE